MPHSTLAMVTMYTLSPANNILRIEVQKYHHDKNTALVRTILSVKSEKKSLWGKLYYEISMKDLFSTYEEAKRESFMRKLKGVSNVQNI